MIDPNLRFFARKRGQLIPERFRRNGKGALRSGYRPTLWKRVPQRRHFILGGFLLQNFRNPPKCCAEGRTIISRAHRAASGRRGGVFLAPCGGGFWDRKEGKKKKKT